MNPRQRAWLSVAVFVPPAALACCLWLWAVDVFNWDEWLIGYNLLQSLRNGSIALADLVRQQNEHRNLAARCFSLLFYPFFHLGRAPEYATLFAMTGGCCLLATCLHRRTAPPDMARDPRPLLAFSALSFSFMQWETFTFGINTSALAPVLGLWAGVCLIWSTARLTLARFGLLALIGFFGSFSFANGLFSWFCLAPLVALRGGSRRRAALLTGAWLLLGAAAWGLYFSGYTRPPHHPRPTLCLDSPLTSLGFFFAYLAGAIDGDRHLLPLAILAGILVMALLFLLGRAAWRQGGTSREQLWPWLAPAAFSLLSAMATTAGRSQISLGQALESRYASFSTPLWMVVAALYFQHGRLLSPGLGRWARRAVTGCVCLFLLASVLAAIVLHNRKPRIEAAHQELYRLTRPERLGIILPDPAFILTTMPVFLEQRAGFAHALPRDEDLRPGSATPGTATVEPTDAMDGRVHGFRLQGTAPAQAGHALVLRCGSRVVGLTSIDAQGTWELFLPENALPTGPVSLEPAALDADGTTLHPLPAAIRLDNPGRSTTSFLLEQSFFVPGIDWTNKPIPRVFPDAETPREQANRP